MSTDIVTPGDSKVNDPNDISDADLQALMDAPVDPDAPLIWSPQEVPVFYNAHVRGWPPKPDKPCKPCKYQSLERAYKGDHKSDAHTAAYYSAQQNRLDYDALGRAPIIMALAMFDLDCPEAHRSGQSASDAWRVSEALKLKLLLKDHPGAFIYNTRGGLRFLYRLPKPIPITGGDQARREWTPLYLQWLAYLRRKYQIEADVACSEWNRLYRLPGATRDEGGKPENWPTFGDPTAMGTWNPTLTEEDIANGIKISGKKPRPAGESEIPRGHSSYVGNGIWYQIFQARNWIIGSDGPGKWQIRCPNEGQHSKGSRPEDTVLWAPKPGSTWGSLHCSHGHCAGFDWEGWTRFFNVSEIEAAKRKCDIEILRKERAVLPPTIHGELTLGSSSTGAK